MGQQVRASITWGGRRWWLNGGYYCNRKGEMLHRAIWVAANGPIEPGIEIHHRNGDKTDNRLENLEALSVADHRRKHRTRGWAGWGQETRARASREQWQAREPYEMECEYCGKRFLTTGTRTRFCGPACRAANRRKDAAQCASAECQHCGKPFLRYRSGLRFCSRGCAYAAKEKPRSVCPVCGTEFRAYGAATVCCSRKCGNVYRDKSNCGRRKATS